MSKQEPNESEACLKKLDSLKKQVEKSMQIQEDANYLNKYRLNFQITQPKNLVGGKLEQHQVEALEWMINLATQESNGILADDMGLGKTIQAIAYLAYIKEENGIKGKHLVICPKSVSTNWIREINKWFPSSRAVFLLSTEGERDKFLRQVVRPKKFDILVATYEGAKRCIYTLSRIHWETLIVDEAHKIKNFESQNFQALAYLQATFKLLLTGTPLSNNLKELWSLLNFIMPHVFYEPHLFNQIQEAAQLFEGTEEEKLAFRIKIAKYFHKIINPYFKRRAKKDLELGLPPKIERTLFVPLSKLQLQMYRNFLRYGNVYGEGQGQNRHYMNARKICLHPYLFPEIEPQQQQDQIFTENTIAACGKLKVLDKLLIKLLSEKHKVLIFSQFTMLLDVLEDYCQFRQFTYCRLDGTTELSEREQYMHDFNDTDKYQIFMLSTKAGGLGINLIGADRVIIYDIDWNPQNDIQAMDRAYRMGQKKPVHVYKLITEHTIEERISQFQKYKLIWDDLVIQKGTFMAKKRDDPFSNFNCQSLVNIGKGEIFHLEVEQNDQTIEEILALGEQKDKKMAAQIQERLNKNFESLNMAKFNPFQDDSQCETAPFPDEDSVILKRRTYQNENRERGRFQRNHILPPYKFYLKSQRIRELEFQIYMELKRQLSQQSKKLLQYLQEQLNTVKKAGKFDDWSQIQFNCFVTAHQIYHKQDFEHIAEFIKTKNKEEVENYSDYFFQKAPNNQRLIDELQIIKIGQTLVKMKFKQKCLISIESSTQEQKVTSVDYLAKSKAELRKEIQQLQRVYKIKQKEQDQLTKKTKKERQAEERIKKKQEQKQKKEEQKRLKKEEEKNKKEEQKVLREEQARINKQEKSKRIEERQKLIQARKEEKEKKNQERLERLRKRESELARRREENQGKIQQTNQSILKQIERESPSSRSSLQSKQTLKKDESPLANNCPDFNNRNLSPLQIIVARTVIEMARK